jgi:HAD superfamily hydrolase (TIGR01509 family)
MAHRVFEQACLKVNPATVAAFFAEVLNGGGSPKYGLGTAVEEARRFGVLLLPPCVNHSQERFVVESDPPELETVHALGTRKNDLVLELIRQQGVEPYEGSVRFAETVRDRGLARAVVSSSTNCKEVLVAAGIDHLFETVVDGVVAEREKLAGKPAPDTFLAAARALSVEPAEAVVLEDALAGVEAGRAGSFGWVVGVDRTGQAEALRSRGADVVVQDLAELLEDG